MKNVVVDVYKARGLFTGLGQFSLNFVQALMAAELTDIHFTLLVPPGLNLEKKPGFDFIEAGIRHRYLPMLNRKYDLWHSLQQFPSHFPNRNTDQILTVHDLNFLVEKDGSKVSKYLHRLQRNVDRSVAVTTISNATREVLEQHIDMKGRPVTTIYNGVKLDDQASGSPPDYVTDAKYFFAIGVFKRKKNFEVLLPMMKHFPHHQLIIAGENETSYGQFLRQQVDELGLSAQVVFPGKVADAEKTWLYYHCAAFMMPSMAEGFGLPVIEAMMAERPVFLNPISSLQEIGGSAAYYFDSYEAKAMAAQVEAQLAEHDVQKNIDSDRLKTYASRFNWATCIAQYLALYASVLQR
ncbi:MAG: glycosyltransferase involved in cell wall biosynthesis [Gammaproteobacteria bacterium]|jgi:glycosyltransferase involved in cell wall biosynthesis